MPLKEADKSYDHDKIEKKVQKFSLSETATQTRLRHTSARKLPKCTHLTEEILQQA